MADKVLDPLLEKLSSICLEMPEAVRVELEGHAQFLVRKKTFAYFLNNHHGDGKIAVTCKVLPGDNQVLAEADPARFYLPAYLAHRGWVAMRLDVGEPDWGEVADLVETGYRLVAPKKLAAGVANSAGTLRQ